MIIRILNFIVSFQILKNSFNPLYFPIYDLFNESVISSLVN
jgi:hypothetical protein